VDNSAVRIPVLEMYKPILACLCRDPRTLVRPIDAGRSLLQNNLIFIRPKDILRPKDGLPAGLHSSRRRKDVVIAVPFIELGPSMVGCVLWPTNTTMPSSRICVPSLFILFTASMLLIRLCCSRTREPGRHSRHRPERTWINPPCHLADQLQRIPRPGRILRFRHEDPPVRIANVDVELTLVISQRRSPDCLPCCGSANSSTGYRRAA